MKIFRETKTKSWYIFKTKNIFNLIKKNKTIKKNTMRGGINTSIP